MSTTDTLTQTVDCVSQSLTKELAPSKDNDDHKEMEQESTEPTNEELLSNAMSGDKIREIMSADGPTVKAVLLKTDGTAVEVDYDSTPSRNHVKDILGAPPSIIGQYIDLDLIVVGPRYVLKPTEFPVNEHKMRYPFNNDTFHGDIFLYRFDQNCVVQDFTLSEYEDFASKIAEDDGKVYQPPPPIDNVQEEEDEEDYEDDEDVQAFDAQDFMREIIVNKVKAEFPHKFGRDPTEEELEQYVAATMQAASGMFGGLGLGGDAVGGMEDIPEEDEDDDDEDEDGDYDPQDDHQQALKDEIEDQPDDEQLTTDKEDIEAAEKEANAPLRDLDEAAEEDMINSSQFESELNEALECVQSQSRADRAKILAMAKQAYIDDMGEEPPEEMLAAALEMFSMDQAEVEGPVDDGDGNEDAEEEEEVDPELFAKELSSALDHIKKLGKSHQAELVEKISNTVTELNGGPPSQEQISNIFGGIKQQFADEAREDFLEVHDKEVDEDDSDYRPDVDEDEKENDTVDDVVGSTKKVKILVTPVKRRKSGSSVGIYLKDQPEDESKKALEAAKVKFEKVHGKAPTEEDSERLKEFMTTDMLFESEVNVNIPFDDEEDDSDYVPEKDANDYSQDVADDHAVDEDEEQENEDTSNIE